MSGIGIIERTEIFILGKTCICMCQAIILTLQLWIWQQIVLEKYRNTSNSHQSECAINFSNESIFNFHLWHHVVLHSFPTTCSGANVYIHFVFLDARVFPLLQLIRVTQLKMWCTKFNLKDASTLAVQIFLTIVW